ncbi:MAG: glutamyl-tRNA reductase [Candidatus Manganitrophus sp.]|nr:glutamyl-tRNA reductase [Candidatus Manganitrophus sp.]
MNIVIVGLNHRTAPVEIRERFSISEKQIGEALYRLKSDPVIEEGLILSTCNRVEVCAMVKETTKGFEAIKNFLIHYQPGISPDVLTPCLYMYAAGDGLRHLFRVAASLDSMIIGEPQILGQIKEAFDQAILHKTTGVVLNKVFKKAISVAKRVRTETKIAENAVSISFAAVELARKFSGNSTGNRPFCSAPARWPNWRRATSSATASSRSPSQTGATSARWSWRKSSTASR